MNYHVFYQSNSLGKNIIITSNTKTFNKKIVKDNYTIFYKDNDIVGINIFNVKDSLADGLYFLDEKINAIVKKYCNIDLLTKSEKIDLFQVGKIIKCDDIKNTHLHLCEVETNNQTLQIVCGAKNARVGLLTVVALPGAMLPNGTIINSGKLMNFNSNGMLCSKKELNLKTDNFNSEGIIELDDSKWKPHQPFKLVYKN